MYCYKKWFDFKNVILLLFSVPACPASSVTPYFFFPLQGNLDFIEESDEARVKDKGVLRSIAMLLSVDESAAEKALCSRVLAAQGDVMEKSHSLEQARRGRDAFAKVRLNIN